MSQKLIFLSVIYVALALTPGAWGLEEEFVKDMKCIPPPKPEKVGVDLKWFGSVDKFYVPLWTKLYVYRIASDILGRDVRDISEFELGTSSCIVMKKNNFVSGFGREIKYNMTGDANSIAFQAPWSGGQAGKYSFHMTDNKSYMLGLTCWDDGETSWSVMSTKTCLAPEVREKVVDYVKSLGFNANNIVSENYEMCGKIRRGNSNPPYFMMAQSPQFISGYFNPYPYFGMMYPPRF